jgi:hypothetical protein
MLAYSLIGTEFEESWNDAQSRYLFHIADLYERCPDKKFYLFVDDDTYVFPQNLLDFASQKSPDLPRVYGRTFFGSEWYLKLYRRNYTTSSFVHGGSGCLYSRGLMRLIGRHLQNCSLIYEMARLPADIRATLCIDRHTEMHNKEVITFFYEFHPDNIFLKMPRPEEGPALTYHETRSREQVEAMYKTAVSHLEGDFYLDWSRYSTRVFRLAEGGIWLVFGFGLCWELLATSCSRVKGAIFPVNSSIYQFKQEFQEGSVLYFRCDDTLQEGELIYFGKAPPPETGFALSLKCPTRRVLKTYSSWNESDRWTLEDPGEL